MNTDFSDLGFTAYPNLIVPLNAVVNILRKSIGLFLVPMFCENKTWVQEMRHKTDKFRDKTAFDSFDEAVEFTKQNWDKVVKPFK